VLRARSNVTAGVAIARRQTSSPNRLVSIDSLRLCGRHQSRSPLLAPSMQPGIAPVMPRRRAALLLSPVQANVAEFRRQTLAPDEHRAPWPKRRRLPLRLGKARAWAPCSQTIEARPQRVSCCRGPGLPLRQRSSCAGGALRWPVFAECTRPKIRVRQVDPTGGRRVVSSARVTARSRSDPLRASAARQG
jgi:hypothetical protein